MKTNTAVKLMIFLLVITLFSSTISAFSIIEPVNNAELLNQQPLLSWESLSGNPHYTITISSQQDLTAAATYTTTNTYYQIQQPLGQGIWYWQVTTANATTAITTFKVVQPPTYAITPKLDSYDYNKQVDFIIDAPLGSAIQMTISKTGFTLPYQTTNLQSKTFSTFLEAGTYSINAEFSYQGYLSTYQNSFMLQEQEIPTHTIIINVTDQDDEPLRNVAVFAESDEYEYEGITNNDGLVTLRVKEDRYDIEFSKENYFDNDLNERITKDENFSITLYHEESFTVSSTPELATTEVIVKPDITIISPVYKEIIKDDLNVNFTLTKLTNIKSCDLLFKNEQQKGWLVAGSTTSLATTNSMYYYEPEEGEAIIKIQCTLKNGDLVTSDPRTIIIPIQPKHHEKAQELLDILDEQTIPSLTDPFIVALRIKESLSTARKKLIQLDEEYFDLSIESSDALEEKKEEINAYLEELNKELIINVEIIDREDVVVLINDEGVEQVIQEYLQEQSLEEKEEKRLKEILIKQQADHTLRAKKVVVEITTLNDEKKYVTGITRSIQTYIDQEETTLQIIEALPYTFLQQTGIPTILDNKGETIAVVEENKLSLLLLPEESYTLLFTGNINVPLKSLNTVAIWQEKDYAEELEQKGMINTITGAVTGMFDSGVNVSPLVWVFLAIIIAGFIVNPLGSFADMKSKKQVRSVTNIIHNTLDLLEQGQPHKAFTQFPQIIQQYESLPEQHQEKLRFAIANLSSELHVYTISQLLYGAYESLSQLETKKDLSDVATTTRTIIDYYKELDPSKKQQLKPQLLSLQQQLILRQELLKSEKPLPKHPLP